MSNQPEWTTERLSRYGIDPANIVGKELLAAINAALAAERLRTNQKEGAFMVASDANQQLREQLAAAEAKIQATLKLPSTTVGGVGYIRASRVERLLANTDTTALDAAIEQKRLEIWANAPDQPDIQEAVIKKLDLVHRHAIAAAQKPLVDALTLAQRLISDLCYGSIELCEAQRIAQRIDEPIQVALAKVKEGK